MDKPLALLGGLKPSEFLRDYWQKKPLLIRAAIPGFDGLLNPNELAGLACEKDVQSRLIRQDGGVWQVQHGPFAESEFTSLPETTSDDFNWTLLVQSVNHHLPEAADLLARFNFIPHARLDDLMVSYAPDGGGVGPHFDSYDVFLLQGSGRRRWKISSQQDLSLIENAPLRILRQFETQQEWVLEAGDMLYLPPHIAHWGIAEGDDCMTYSIGFRAPQHNELTYEFLGYLQDNAPASGIYTDADLTLQTHPAQIGEPMLNQVHKILQNITWNNQQVADFVGKYLTEPKSHIVFSTRRHLSTQALAKKMAKQNLCLNLRSQMLFHDNDFYLNGESLSVPLELIDDVRKLADYRTLGTVQMSDEKRQALASVIQTAYLAGYVDCLD